MANLSTWLRHVHCDNSKSYFKKCIAIGASDDPCSETFAGKRIFSEVETRRISAYIESIKDKLFAYLAFHSYGQQLMYPYGDTKEPMENYRESVRIFFTSITLSNDFKMIN